MKEFVEYLVKNLVDRPDSVEIACLEGEKGLLVEIRASREDLPKIIGRQGKTIKSLRTLVMVAAARLGRHARVEIIE